MGPVRCDLRLPRLYYGAVSLNVSCRNPLRSCKQYKSSCKMRAVAPLFFKDHIVKEALRIRHIFRKFSRAQGILQP